MNSSKSIFFVLAICIANAFAGEIITSPPVTNWGDWNPFQHCPEGTLAKGFQLKHQESQGIFIDDTALNGIRLFCGYPTDPQTVNITSGEGVHGEWGRVFSCGGGFIYGFQLRVEHNGIDDETATGNVRVFCSNQDPDVFTEGDGNTWGLWGDIKKCARTEGLCGVQTQLEPDGGLLHDDTAMNNLAAECCDQPPPPTKPTTTEKPETTEAATTEAPTTEAPTTEAPTTEAPVTDAPTTEAPTTEGSN